MGLCFLNGAWARGTLSEYRSTTSLRGVVALCSWCDYVCILPARVVREYSVSHHRSPEGSWGRRDDNDAIIKIKRAGHSLATIDRTERSWVRLESSSGITRNENARDEICFLRAGRNIFLAWQFLLSFLFHIPEIRILFRGVLLYLARHSVSHGWFTANCKCKFDSWFLSKGWK